MRRCGVSGIGFIGWTVTGCGSGRSTASPCRGSCGLPAGPAGAARVVCFGRVGPALGADAAVPAGQEAG